MDVFGLVGVFFSSSALSAILTTWFNRRKVQVEVSSQSIKTALDLEERVYVRFTSAMHSLDIAQNALDSARKEIRILEDYVEVLTGVLDEAGLSYPQRRDQWYADSALYLKGQENA